MPPVKRRSPQGNPVMLPMVPVGFPVPSYASAAFLVEAEKWLANVAALLAPLRFPEGPIVLCQIDNEGALYFRDGLYDQDYRPEAIAALSRIPAQEIRHRSRSSRAPTGGGPIHSTGWCPPPSSTPRPPTSSPSTSTGPSSKSASWPDRWRA